MKYLPILLLPLFLSGCFGTSPIIKTEVVHVDRIVPAEVPQPPALKRPTLPIDELSPAEAADEGKLVQAYKATVKALQGYAFELEQVIDGYRKPAK